MKTCDIFSSSLHKSNRSEKNNKIIEKNNKELNITYNSEDSFEQFESELNSIAGKSSLTYNIKKKLVLNFVSFVSAVVILFALLSVSIYEDVLKKIIFEMPFEWSSNDSISLFFSIIFFIGLFLMPSIIEGESSEFKNLIFSWFNKDIRKEKKFKVLLSSIDKKTKINLYNFDLAKNDNFIWSIVAKNILEQFDDVNFYARSEKIETLKSYLNKFDITNVNVKLSLNEEKLPINPKLLSNEEKKLSSLLLMCSSTKLPSIEDKNLFSLELFEYSSKNFFDLDDENQNYNGYQGFINSCFNDFYFLEQNSLNQIYLINEQNLSYEQSQRKKLAYHLKNSLEDCVEKFENPISLILLYYFVKDIVVDENRIIKILNKLIKTIESTQDYKLIKTYWFDIAGKFFDCSNLDEFDKTITSYYRKIPISYLEVLANLFIRNGFFEDAILVYKYLFEVNQDKYSIRLSSLYERMGSYDKALETLPNNIKNKYKEKPNEIKLTFLQKKAWIIVSQRNEELKNEGLNLLEEMKELLYSSQDDIEPLFLWHYYNNKANYDEWNCDYESAVNNYMKCLKVPTLGAYEYGATFVNLAIAYRFMFIQSDFKDMSLIESSVKYGDSGLNLKSNVGERDEISVVVHNQALNILYKLYANENKEESSYVYDLTMKALKTLEEINSTKKLGMLLIENYISACLASKDSSYCVSKIEEFLEVIDKNELKQLLNVYKLFVQNNRITNLENLDRKLNERF